MFLHQIKINDMGFVDVLLQMMGESDLISISCSYETLNCFISEHLDDENAKQCLAKYFDAHFENIFDKMTKMIGFGNCLVRRYSMRILSILLSSICCERTKKMHMVKMQNLLRQFNQRCDVMFKPTITY